MRCECCPEKKVPLMMAQPAFNPNVDGVTEKPVVLITGASGFIGSAVIKRLSDNYTLVGLDCAGPRLHWPTLSTST